MLAALVALVLTGDQEVPRLRSGEPAAFVLEADGARLAGHGAVARFAFDAPARGGLVLWPRADGDALWLRLENEHGGLIIEDERSGGPGVPCILHLVEPGLRLSILVAAKDPGGSAQGELRFEFLEDSDESRAFVARTREQAAAARCARDEGDLARARSVLAAGVRELLAEPRACRSLPGYRELSDLGRLARDLGDLELASAVMERQLEMDEAWLPAARTSRVRTLLNASDVQRQLGDPSGARTRQEALVELLTRTQPPNGLELQKARLLLAATLDELGHPERARVLLETLIDAGTPPELDLLTPARNNLANLLRESGDLEGALAVQRELLETFEREAPETDLQLQTVRANLALTLFELGDVHLARSLFERVLEVRASSLPETHPDRISATLNMAHALRNTGAPGAASELEREMIALLEREGRSDSPAMRSALRGLSASLSLDGDLEGALAAKRESLARCERDLPAGHPETARARANVGYELARQGDLESAELQVRATIVELSAALPQDHYDLQIARRSLGAILAALGRFPEARFELKAMARNVSQSIRSQALVLAPRALEALALQTERQVESLLSLTANDGPLAGSAELHSDAFGLVETLRGVALLNAHVCAAAPADPALEALRSRCAEAAARLAASSPLARGRDEFETAVRARDDAQRAILGHLASREEVAALRHVPEAARLAARLAEDQALVSYRFYEPTARFAEASQPSGRRLAAFVVRRKTPLTRFELGAEELLVGRIEAWRSALIHATSGVRGVAHEQGEAGSESEREAGRALRALVLDPLGDALDGVREITVALDGALHLLPLDALPDGEGRVGDRVRVHVRSALWEMASAPAAKSTSSSLVLLGGVDYGESSATTDDADTLAQVGVTSASSPAIVGANSRPMRALLRNGARHTFAPLPATQREIEAIARLFPAPTEHVSKLAGSCATREELVAALGGARWVHLATHGLATEGSDGAGAPTRASDFVTENDARAQISPMLLCGLALAGANRAPDAAGRVDGWLTAEELASLDLRACELAVLSACETGLGVSVSGQGVASLQKALHMAGARSAVTSLWSVPDQATEELMLDFYRQLWIEKKPKHQALWEAKRKLRDAKDERGAPLYSTRDWAAWVLTGEPE